MNKVFGHREQYRECTETPVPVSLRLEQFRSYSHLLQSR